MTNDKARMKNWIVSATQSLRHSDFVIRHSLTGECRIRTCEGISHQIYSLTRLTASVTPRVLFFHATRALPPPPTQHDHGLASNDDELAEGLEPPTCCLP